MSLLAETEATGAAAGLAEVSDCKGVCLPTPAGSTIDLLYAHCLVSLRRPALRTLEEATDYCTGWIRSYLKELYDTIAYMPIYDFISTFRPAVAFFHLHPLIVERDRATAALSLVQFVVGGPHGGNTALIIPEQAIRSQGLYLPHLNALLGAGFGPIAVQGDASGVKFTWTDGVSIGLPTGGLKERTTFDDGRMQSDTSSVAGWPILNRIPEVHDPFLSLVPAPADAPSEPEIAQLDAALDLLRDVWPEAYAATRRHFHSAGTAACADGPFHQYHARPTSGDIHFFLQ